MKLKKLQPVTRQSTETIVIENLRSFILSGEVPPGGRLTEAAMSEQLGVSRATLRLALHRLAGEGLLTQIPYTGWEVAQLSSRDVWEIWTLRGALEGLASRLVVMRDAPEVFATLEEAYAELESACARGNMRAITAADFALHQSIIQGADNARLSAQYRVVEQQVRLFIMTSNVHVATGPEDIIAQHVPLMEAFRRRDAAAAADAAWIHDETEGHRLMDWLIRTGVATPDQPKA
ncbi:GntR family transcriptional regulator [Pseudooceanicola sp. CBS1P-1]|uniref:GntR family transcriptional regulator n=1 Tax=Pseudooceanicola TaxID=1679449 RepID=UPI001367AA3F|nr:MULTISPECIES: GntR family transcriptional regulator [Pseudooceanicola]MBT9383521.1 GntR family transcriptional regulator [Pseudooceanicola endophyticus]